MQVRVLTILVGGGGEGWLVRWGAQRGVCVACLRVPRPRRVTYWSRRLDPQTGGGGGDEGGLVRWGARRGVCVACLRVPRPRRVIHWSRFFCIHELEGEAGVRVVKTQ